MRLASWMGWTPSWRQLFLLGSVSCERVQEKRTRDIRRRCFLYVLCWSTFSEFVRRDPNESFWQSEPNQVELLDCLSRILSHWSNLLRAQPDGLLFSECDLPFPIRSIHGPWRNISACPRFVEFS